MRLPFWSSNPTAIQALDPAPFGVAGIMQQRWMDEERARHERFQRNWGYYYGTGIRKPLAMGQAGHNDNVLTNYCRLVIDYGVAFLVGAGVAFVCGEEDAPDETATNLLDGFWEQNNESIRLAQIAMNGGVCGHTFVKLIVDPTREYPRILVLDPANVRVLWDPDDFEKVVAYRLQWTGMEPTTGRPITKRQDIVPTNELPTAWTIIDSVSYGDRPTFIETGRTAWPWAFAPIFACQNLPAPNEYWGVPDLDECIIDSQDTLNYTYSNIMRIIRYWAHPILWGSGFRASDMTRAPDQMVVLPDAASKLGTLEMQSDLSSSLEFLRRNLEAFHAMARVPEVATGRTEDLGALSGVALRIMYGPLVTKTATKRELYGEMLENLCRAVLEIKGRSDVQVEVHWQDAAPQSDKENVEAAVAKEGLGVSKHSLLAELGYDYEEEQAKRETEAEAESKIGEAMLTSYERGQMATPGYGPPRNMPEKEQPK